ncbi:hypothetical protein GJ496_001457 [Pomphorhynchus laevis]|nr:hypothetical protein GJ496_001457 [Pomphorhynchus laevis]
MNGKQGYFTIVLFGSKIILGHFTCSNSTTAVDINIWYVIDMAHDDNVLPVIIQQIDTNLKQIEQRSRNALIRTGAFLFRFHEAKHSTTFHNNVLSLKKRKIEDFVSLLKNSYLTIKQKTGSGSFAPKHTTMNDVCTNIKSIMKSSAEYKRAINGVFFISNGIPYYNSFCEKVTQRYSYPIIECSPIVLTINVLISKKYVCIPILNYDQRECQSSYQYYLQQLHQSCGELKSLARTYFLNCPDQQNAYPPGNVNVDFISDALYMKTVAERSDLVDRGVGQPILEAELKSSVESAHRYLTNNRNLHEKCFSTLDCDCKIGLLCSIKGTCQCREQSQYNESLNLCIQSIKANKLGAGAIVGIVIGCFLLILALAAVGYIMIPIRRRDYGQYKEKGFNRDIDDDESFLTVSRID